MRKRYLHNCIVRLFMLVGCLACDQAISDGGLLLVNVKEPYVNSVPPGVKSTAAYMTIANTSDQGVVLLGAKSEVARKVTLHQSYVSNGMMKMKHEEKKKIPAHSSLRLMPMGLHLMLKDIVKPIVPGGTIPITLWFEGDQMVVVETAVRDLHHDH